ncbi:DNA-binding protein [Streptobacillus moniliformis]|nr:DNA-binding protein [Streptobacillus moniliformis]QXW65629.1 hypothetical protein KX935_07695 [Streptobacillus moniliformis]
MKRFTIRVPVDVNEKLVNISKNDNISKNTLIILSIKKFLKDFEIKK